MRPTLWITVTILLFLTATSATGQSTRNLVLRDCLISPKDEIEIPAEEAGVIVKLDVREGTQVEQGQLLGRIDDREPQIQGRLAQLQQQAAQEQADNDVSIRFATAARLVAEADYLQSLAANQRVRGTFPLAEVRKLKLESHRAMMQIEQSQLDQRIAEFTSRTKAVEVDAAQTSILRRQMKAPVAGEVIEVAKHVGEWANPGETVLKLMRSDTMRVEGFVNASQFDPSEVSGRPVLVTLIMARGRQVEFSGTIVYVSAQVQAGGEYAVWAEVSNRRENDQWLLRSGLSASMRIVLGK